MVFGGSGVGSGDFGGLGVESVFGGSDVLSGVFSGVVTGGGGGGDGGRGGAGGAGISSPAIRLAILLPGNGFGVGFARNLLARNARVDGMCCSDLRCQSVRRQKHGNMDHNFALKNARDLPAVGLGAAPGAVPGAAPGLYGTGGGAGFWLPGVDMGTPSARITPVPEHQVPSATWTDSAQPRSQCPQNNVPKQAGPIE